MNLVASLGRGENKRSKFSANLEVRLSKPPKMARLNARHCCFLSGVESISKRANHIMSRTSTPHSTNMAKPFSLCIVFLASAVPVKISIRVACTIMSVGFGFSVGDFIAGIQLVRDIITSLQASGGSSLEYQALASELFSLERALIEVKSLKCLQDQSDQLDALKVAATQCQHTIDRFMTKIQKYQPSLTAQGSGSKWRDSLRKVQWALCKKEDIAAFKAEVSGHAVSINLLVATAQLFVVPLLHKDRYADEWPFSNASTNLGLQSLQHNKQQNETSNALAKHNTWSVAVIDSLKDVTQS